MEGLIKRLLRYSKKCIDERLDSDFGDAVTEAIGVLSQMNAKQWIPVTERLPDYDKAVLCHCRANIIETLCLENDGHWYGYSGRYMKGFVTHWMPLPEPPKEETDG